MKKINIKKAAGLMLSALVLPCYLTYSNQQHTFWENDGSRQYVPIKIPSNDFTLEINDFSKSVKKYVSKEDSVILQHIFKDFIVSIEKKAGELILTIPDIVSEIWRIRDAAIRTNSLFKTMINTRISLGASGPKLVNCPVGPEMGVTIFNIPQFILDTSTFCHTIFLAAGYTA